MKATSPSLVESARFSRIGSTAAVAFLAVACQGEVLEPPRGSPPASDAGSDSEGSPAAGRGNTPGRGGASGNGSVPAGGSPNGVAGSPGADVPADVNRVPIHRLNNAEYDNTMSDLLGVSSRPGAAFIADEKLLGFDNIAAAFAMNDARYEQYFNAADALVEEAFGSQTLRERVMTCTPKAGAEAECAREILGAFAKRAFRRPVTDAEVARLVALTEEAAALGEDFSGSIRHALKAILSSADFLYRIELDADPASAEPHALAPHELASRLSYLFLGTMPDAPLFERAESGALLDDDALAREVTRLLSDARSDRFVESFAGQWLGLRALGSHQVDETVFPEWTEELRAAMVEEGLLYFAEFLRGDRPMSEFFTADVNFVNAALAKHYGFAPRNGHALVEVVEAGDQRRGFLGLASFLTLTSFAGRTAPTLRGKWVLENLLCTELPPPPATVPELEEDDPAAANAGNVRERLEEHRKNPSCAGCHQALDPIGLGLENFDAIGRRREKYPNGDPVDAAGELPTGEAFNGIVELSSILAEDERLADCVVKKTMTYALSREVGASDARNVAKIKEAWSRQGMGLAALLEQIVLNETFRFRRGEP